MPRKDIILNILGFAIKKTSGYNPLVLDVSYRNVPRCIHCNGKKIAQKVEFYERGSPRGFWS